MRRRRKVDANQAEIVEGLRACGWFVEVLSDVGRGVPDLLVGGRGIWCLVEIKSPGGRLTPDQASWAVRSSLRNTGPLLIAYSLQSALAGLADAARARRRPTALAGSSA